jgi:hypothetical protein
VASFVVQVDAVADAVAAVMLFDCCTQLSPNCHPTVINHCRYIGAIAQGTGDFFAKSGILDDPVHCMQFMLLAVLFLYETVCFLSPLQPTPISAVGDSQRPI